jgi:hypothetical protein
VDQSPLVDDQISDGRRLVERFAADGNPVRTAFWVKTSDEGHLFLYVVTDIADVGGPAVAYRAVRSALGKLGDSWVAASDVKVVGLNDPVAKAALNVMSRHPGRMAIRFGGQNLGPLEVDQVYIYPPHLFTHGQVSPMTKEDIGREIVRLMNRGPGVFQPSRVTLRDGTHFDGVPFSLQLGSQNAVIAQFVADREPAPRVVPLDDIASIA